MKVYITRYTAVGVYGVRAERKVNGARYPGYTHFSAGANDLKQVTHDAVGSLYVRHGRQLVARLGHVKPGGQS